MVVIMTNKDTRCPASEFDPVGDYIGAINSVHGKIQRLADRQQAVLGNLERIAKALRSMAPGARS